MAKRLPRRRSSSASEACRQAEPIHPSTVGQASFRDFLLLWYARASVFRMQFGRFLGRWSPGLKTCGRAFSLLLLLLGAAMAVGFMQASRESPPPSPVLDRGSLLFDLAHLRSETFPDHPLGTTSGAILLRFPDLEPSSKAEKELLTVGLMRGFPDGSFRPQTAVTRGEGITILARFLTAVGSSDKATPIQNDREFSDVRPGHWLFKNLSALRSLDISTVWPDRNICPDRLLSIADWASLTSRLRLHASVAATTAAPDDATSSEPAVLNSATRERLRQMLDSAEPRAEPPVSVDLQDQRIQVEDTPQLTLTPVEGCIVDGLNGRRLSQATLLIGSHTVILQPDGSFRIPAYSQQILEMTAYCEGYQTLTLKHRVGFKPGPVVFGLKLAQTAFEGEILDSETGLPVADARINVGTRQGSTDADGRFRILGVAPTWHQIVCRAPGFMDAVELLYVKNNDERRVFKLRPQRRTMSSAQGRQPKPAMPSEQPYSEYLEFNE